MFWAGHLQFVAFTVSRGDQSVHGTFSAVGHRNGGQTSIGGSSVNAFGQCARDVAGAQRALIRIGYQQNIQGLGICAWGVSHTNSPTNQMKMIEVTPMTPVVSVCVR